MTVQYTTNFNFPLLDDGGKSWGAVINGVLTDLDTYLTTLNTTNIDLLTYENEILVHDGDVLNFVTYNFV